MHKNRKPIFGVGINDWESPAYMGNKQMKEYQVWVSMLARCFSNKEKARKPCYESSSCSDDWLLFSNFVRDLRLMTGFDNMMKLSWQLDKDLILKGNKNYSSEVCCLIPKELNVFLTNGRQKEVVFRLVFMREKMKISQKHLYLQYFTRANLFILVILMIHWLPTCLTRLKKRSF